MPFSAGWELSAESSISADDRNEERRVRIRARRGTPALKQLESLVSLAVARAAAAEEPQSCRRAARQKATRRSERCSLRLSRAVLTKAPAGDGAAAAVR